MESSSLQMEELEEKGDTKRKKESFPQALAHLQALQNEFARASHCKRCFLFEQTSRNRLKLSHQHKCCSTLSPYRLASKFASQSALSIGYLALNTQKCEPNGVDTSAELDFYLAL